MPYDPNIPQPSDNLSDSQSDILQNFQTLDTVFAINHFLFSDASANKGKHKFIELPELAAIPPGLVSGEETIYSKVVAGSGQVFFTRGSSGVEIQLTGPGTPSALQNGYTFLAGGIVIQWGLVVQAFSSGSTTGTTLFNTPFLNTPFIVTGNPTFAAAAFPNSQASVNIRGSQLISARKTSFDWQFFTNSSNYTGFTWIAIGN